MRKSKARKLVNWLWRLSVPAALLGFLILKLDAQKILEAILSARLDLLLAALVLFALPIPLRAWRWQLIMRANGICWRWRNIFPVYLVGYSGQFFLPTGLGDTVRVFYLVEAGYPPSRSFVTILIDKFSDYFSYVLFGLLGFFIFPAFHIAGGRELALVTLTLFAATLSIYYLRRYLRTALKERFNNLINKQAARLAIRSIAEVWQDLRRVTFKQAVIWGLVSIVIALIHNSSLYLLSLSLELNLSYFQILGIIGLLNMILSAPLLSVSVGGFGIREGILVMIFSILGRSAESAIAFSFLMFAISILWHGLTLLAWVFHPLNLKNLNLQARTLISGKPDENIGEISV
jgi:uncharacterized protein (TIRG00374 family)